MLLMYMYMYVGVHVHTCACIACVYIYVYMRQRDRISIYIPVHWLVFFKRILSYSPLPPLPPVSPLCLCSSPDPPPPTSSQKRAALPGTSNRYSIGSYGKTRHISSHRSWWRQHSRKKRVPWVGKRVRDSATPTRTPSCSALTYMQRT